MNTVLTVVLIVVVANFLYLFGNLLLGYRQAIKIYDGDEEQ